MAMLSLRRNNLTITLYLTQVIATKWFRNIPPVGVTTYHHNSSIRSIFIWFTGCPFHISGPWSSINPRPNTCYPFSPNESIKLTEMFFIKVLCLLISNCSKITSDLLTFSSGNIGIMFFLGAFNVTFSCELKVNTSF